MNYVLFYYIISLSALFPFYKVLFILSTYVFILQTYTFVFIHSLRSMIRIWKNILKQYIIYILFWFWCCRLMGKLRTNFLMNKIPWLLFLYPSKYTCILYSFSPYFRQVHTLFTFGTCMKVNSYQFTILNFLSFLWDRIS